MKKLALTPDQDNYAVDDGANTISNKLNGGASRIRKDLLNAPLRVNVQWTCDLVEYDYLRTFYRTTQDGSEPFLMDLLTNAANLTLHVCRFIPNTFKLSGVKGVQHRVTAQLEVIPQVPDDALDEGVVTSYEAFGIEGSESYALLAEIVNINMPANIK